METKERIKLEQETENERIKQDTEKERIKQDTEKERIKQAAETARCQLALDMKKAEVRVLELRIKLALTINRRGKGTHYDDDGVPADLPEHPTL